MNITVSLFGQIVAFILLIWFVNRVLWGPLSTMMEGRRKRIAEGLAAGERGRHEQELAEKRAQQVIGEAKEQANEIISQAQRRGNEIVDESKDTARVEGERILTSAQAEIEQQTNKAKGELRTQVGSIAIAGAEKILGREIDKKSHTALLEELVSRI